MFSILKRSFFRGLSQKVWTRSYGAAAIDAQQQLALKENCILVDANDKALGSSSKYDCHRVNKETGNLKLHRAFSVFLFNSEGEMLMQRRSSHKVTYPDTYTNSCCSHPLYDIDGERVEDNEIGIRRAAQRRLNYELGIPKDQVSPERFHYLTRIHYKDEGDGVWGEHEIDYILFLQKDVDLNPNENEVSEVRYIKRSEIDEIVNLFNAPFTPWFKLILKHKLKVWWDNLDSLDKCVDTKNIIRFL
ncbi:isopentenyl-diphosphate Delta-isomerase 1 [Ceratitis capitata]|uniref:isopentenyl-diphosphate Delta-isomerase n=1 Tax=Ceratitis capitata TaxID=7213 RepID=W8AL09_CERCA|nr:isopentenyl-diphosphate Delta-isomerase 1 [Ceratitis capitata]CAD6994023.1 unnamed protein product [Ceratitis capitata]